MGLSKNGVRNRLNALAKNEENTLKLLATSDSAGNPDKSEVFFNDLTGNSADSVRAKVQQENLEQSEVLIPDETEPQTSAGDSAPDNRAQQAFEEAFAEVEAGQREEAEPTENRTEDSGEAEIDYQSKTRDLISDFLNHVEVAVKKEKEAREQKRLEEERKKIEYEHTLAVTTVLKKATDYFSKTHPVVITPCVTKTVTLRPTLTTYIYEKVSVNSVISVSEIRAIAEQSPHFVLLDDMVDVDPRVSVCLELAINMLDNEQ